jgi:spermidine/putrescine transport system substrate-binding protein
VWLIAALNLLAACSSPAASPTPAPTPQLAKKLILYNWPGYMPQSVLDAFTAESGVKVIYEAYETPEQAVDNMRAGQVYDVVVMGNELIPTLVADGLLAEIDYRNVPNFKNVSANFRDLAYDPDNRHSVPFNWGTTGLLVRSDLVAKPVTRWADLWDERYAGKIAVWPIESELIPIALKSLGYSANSENPAELETALQRLLELKRNVVFWDLDAPSIVPPLASGEAVMADGWAYDALTGREENEAIVYVLPEEGTILWGDNFVIPANSPNKRTAELFLNFLLRAEIGAQIANELYYANANEAARALIDPSVLNDPLVFPPEDALHNAEILLPLSPEGQALHDDIWARFMSAP